MKQLTKKFSDHQPYFIKLKYIQHKEYKPKYIKVTKQNIEALNVFYNEVDASLANVGLNTYINTNPNINYNAIYQIIRQAKFNHLPEKLIKFHEHKHKLSLWITRGIL